MIIQQIYNSNTTRTFPLEEGNALGIPNDIIVDMSITVLDNIVPVVTAIAITDSIVFLALEDSVSHKGIGQIHINNPIPFSVYKFDMPMIGAYGWIVLGSGINTTQSIRDIEATLDPSAILTAPLDPDSLDSITVNSKKQDILGVLGLNALTSVISIDTEIRNIDSVGDVDCIVLSRNNNVLTQDQIFYAFTETDNIRGAILRIAGAVPDASGNIQIHTDPSSSFLLEKIITPSPTEEIGLVFNQSIEACSDYDPRYKVLHSKCELGISTEEGLPCDPLVVSLTPKFGLPDCGCSDAPEGAYTLVVNGGTGSGSYMPGAIVNILYVPPTGGGVFSNWVVNTGPWGAVENTSDPSTTVTMPAEDMVITSSIY